jgi:hypothetical protein
MERVEYQAVYRHLARESRQTIGQGMDEGIGIQGSCNHLIGCVEVVRSQVKAGQL